MAQPGPSSLPMPRKLLPNWATAGLLGVFAGGVYMYTMRAVGQDDLDKELEREAQRLAKTSAASKQ